MKLNIFLFFTMIITLASSVQAETVHGIFRVVKGQIEVKAAADGSTSRARGGQKVFPQDKISAGKDSRAKIVMIDNNEINISPESQIVLEKYEYNPEQNHKNV